MKFTEKELRFIDSFVEAELIRLFMQGKEKTKRYSTFKGISEKINAALKD